MRWKPAGGKDLRLVVIKPLAYRPPGSSKITYRKPAYLLVTDPDLALDKVIQYYVWRWEIEVNFHDEKQLFGVGQAHLRTETSVQQFPALLVAAYSILHLACRQSLSPDDRLPLPLWRKATVPARKTTQELIALLRYSLWGNEINLPTFDRFMQKNQHLTKRSKLLNPAQSAVLYSRLC